MSVLEVENLSVAFRLRGGGLLRARSLHAVRDVSFSIDEAETLALVGESGSGKSTTARAVLRLLPSEGSVRFLGRELCSLSERQIRPIRRGLQMVFQDPYSSLNPSIQVGRNIGEPLSVHERLSSSEIESRVRELLEMVGLAPQHALRYPHEFSGGQRQRIAIARAIALRPKLIVCDEAVSALDVSTQSQILNLLEDLSDSTGVSYLFIAHDIALVQHIADRVAVMYLGKIVEEGPASEVLEKPVHPYTQSLVSAIPVPDPVVQRSRRRILLEGDPPDPSEVEAGCPFASRCPAVMEHCRTVMPPSVDVQHGGTVACHLVSKEGKETSEAILEHLTSQKEKL